MKIKSNNAKILVDYQGIAPATLSERGGRLLLPLTSTPPAGITSKSPELLEYIDGVIIDSNRRQDPPHLAFANLDLSQEKRLKSFLNQYGIAGCFCNRDWNSREWYIDSALLKKYQNQLRQAWGKKQFQLWFHPRSVTVDATDRRLRLVTSDLWTLICIRFLIDSSDEHRDPKVCGLGGCRWIRYFLKSRPDQQFCTKTCRALSNMEKWRSKPKNRKQEKLRRKTRYALHTRKTKPSQVKKHATQQN
jgi:hypothetical protein